MLGQRQVLKRKKHEHFDETEKRMIIEDYLQSGMTKKEIWKKYTGCSEEHGLLLYWMYKYGYKTENNVKSVIFATQKSSTVKKGDSETEFTHLQLQKRVLELEKRLQDAEMKSLAWQTMVELAEREFNISIKKNFNTKPLKR